MLKLIVLVYFLLPLSQAVAAGHDDDFLAARDAFRVGNSARLNMLAKRLDGYVLEPYVAYYQLHMRLGDAGEEAVRDFVAKHADSPLSDRLRADWLRILGQQKKWTLYREEYASLESKEDVELACFSLQERLERGDVTASQEARLKWLTGSELPLSCKPAFTILLADGALDVADVWARIRLALEWGNISVARQVVADYLSEKEKAGLKNLGKVADNPQRFLDSSSVETESRSGRELLMFAIYRLARSSPSGAQSYWEQFHARLGSAEQSYLRAQMAFQAARKLDPIALKWFHEAGDTPLNELQLTWRVRAALRAQDWPEVLAGIAAMPEALQSQGAWRYWKARGLKAGGKLGPANAILATLSHEHNFYGQLAVEELGEVVSNPVASHDLSADEVKSVNGLPGIRRALALYQLDLRTEANREWVWATRGFDDKRLLAAAEVARRNDWIDRSINTADKTRELHDFDLRYPAPHRDVMRIHVREHELDEAWVYGLIRQESRFMRQARSSVGASGLMQLMPATAQWIAKRIGFKHFKQNLINQIDTNISFGTYYLKYVLDNNDGQAVLATASYNAGPARARRWKAERALEGAIYAESIPFAETRSYVQKVMSNASYYANRFGRRAITLKQRLGTITGRDEKTGCQNLDERSPSCDP